MFSRLKKLNKQTDTMDDTISRCSTLITFGGPCHLRSFEQCLCGPCFQQTYQQTECRIPEVYR